MTCHSVCRYLKSAMHLQLQNWAITPGMTTSLEWSHQTPTRHRPWLTSWQPLGGTMSQRWLPKATMERVVWRRSPRSPEKLVSVFIRFGIYSCRVAEHRWVLLRCVQCDETTVGVLPGLKWVILLLACLPKWRFWQQFKKRGRKCTSLDPFGKGSSLMS